MKLDFGHSEGKYTLEGETNQGEPISVASDREGMREYLVSLGFSEEEAGFRLLKLIQDADYSDPDREDEWNTSSYPLAA